MAKLTARGAVEIARRSNSHFICVLRQTTQKKGNKYDILIRPKPTGGYTISFSTFTLTEALAVYASKCVRLDELAKKYAQENATCPQ